MTINKSVRLQDIAKSLNISVSTVSRALSEDSAQMISPSVVDQVTRKAQKMGYIPNKTASALRQRTSQMVGMIVPDLLNPVFPLIIQGVQELLAEQGKSLIVSYSQNDRQTALIEAKRLLSFGVSGLVIASAFLDDPCVDFCRNQKVPMVLVNRSINNGDDIQRVLSDDWQGMQLAISHLKQLGHQKIAHLEGPIDILQGKERKLSFEKLCSIEGMDGYSISGSDDFSIASGHQSTKAFLAQKLNQKVTAIIAGNDLMAIGAIEVLRLQGYQVPEDFSMVGFNNMPFCDYLDPPLTSVAIPHFELGRLGAQLLLDEIKGGYEFKKRIFRVSSYLVPRKSSIKN